jgi:hypothetical protein
MHLVLSASSLLYFHSSHSKFSTIADLQYDAEVRAEAKREDEKYLDAMAKRFSEGELAKYHLAVTTAVAIDPDVAAYNTGCWVVWPNVCFIPLNCRSWLSTQPVGATRPTRARKLEPSSECGDLMRRYVL